MVRFLQKENKAQRHLPYVTQFTRYTISAFGERIALEKYCSHLLKWEMAKLGVQGGKEASWRGRTGRGKPLRPYPPELVTALPRGQKNLWAKPGWL